MCLTGRCCWEGMDGTCDPTKSECPIFMDVHCKCGSELKQLQEDGNYHCMDCDKVIE